MAARKPAFGQKRPITPVEKGADVNAAHKDSSNDALFFARERGTPEIAALFTELGAKPR